MSDVEAGGGDNDNVYTEVTSESYLDQMKDSCKGAGFGILLFFLSFVLLIWNEGRTVRRARDLDEGRENVFQLDPTVDSRQALQNIWQDNQNKDPSFVPLLYITGDLTDLDQSLMDPLLGVTGDDALKLQRQVEMYQWSESSTSRREKRSNGQTVTVTEYSYSKTWSPFLIDSTSFREQRSDRVNPTSFPFEAASWIADPIWLTDANDGEVLLTLGDPVVDRVDWWQSVNDVSVADVQDNNTRSQLSQYGNNGLFYASSWSATSVKNGTSTTGTPNNPTVGDVRITFNQVPADTVSIIAGLLSPSSSGSDDTNVTSLGTLGNYMTKGNRPLLLVERGIVSSDDMFSQAENENTTLAWILRFIGFAIMATSVYLVLQPISQAVDIIPFVGDCLQGGLEGCIFPTIAILVALPLSLITVGLAWIFYRPLWAVPILVVSIGVSVWLCMRTKKVTDHQSSDSDEDFKPSAPSSNYQSGSGGDSGFTPSAPNSNYQSSGGGGGDFANALDVPYSSNNGNYNNNGKADEAEIPVVSAEPYVPQVYKP